MIKSVTSEFYNKNVKVKQDYLIELDEVKRHLRIDELDTSDDEYLSATILDAVDIAENYINADIAYTKNACTIYDFTGDRIRLNEGNLIVVSGITGTSVSYGVFDNIIDFNIYFDEYIHDKTDLSISYYSGFSKNDLPKTIKRAILIKIADLFDVERNGYSTSSYKANDTFERLLSYYKKY